METAEIRRRWLRFFESKAHTVVPSAPLLYDDPNLLFVNAGMVPFKPYFLGAETPAYTRATSVQKCVRTGDIDEVGKTTRHGTFFQMNGNFSFGDYFKKEAIEFAWEFVTGPQEEGNLGFDPEKVWVTVLGPGHHPDHPEGDIEARNYWRAVGIPDERIQGRSLKDNYWHMGVEGPGGPCSEIYIDRGPEYGPDGGPEADEDRFLEIWNLVFQTEQITDVTAKDKFTVEGLLPSKNIDTGMGLERVAFLMQGVDNMYEIDEVYPVIAAAEKLSGRKYGADNDADVRFRVVADHVRSSLMLIGDGVAPGNEGRGYVLRRLLRRAIRSMRLLGVTDPVLPELFPVSVAQMEKSYPELRRDWDRISNVAFEEEHAFRRTLTAGTAILDTAVANAKSQGRTQLSGADAFSLHDTYGFPIDLTLEMASEQGLSVDEEGFRSLMNEQKQRAKADAKAKKMGHTDLHLYREIADTMSAPTEFLGYTETTAPGRIMGVLSDSGSVRSACEGDEIELVLDRTPFYAESGGQLADKGIIEVDGARIEITDVQRPVTGLVVHKGRVLAGEFGVGQTATAIVDAARRRDSSRAHTATHIVHQALRDNLASTATQAGSENMPGRLRFDFSWNNPIDPDTFATIEEQINRVILGDEAVEAATMPKGEALASGALAMFGEKYPEHVRVVSIGDWSRELCGGTHAMRVGQLGVVKLLSEQSVGSGVRRVEALVGMDAYGHLSTESLLLSQISDLVKAKGENIPDRIAALMAKLKSTEKELTAMRAAQLRAANANLANDAIDISGVAVLTHDLGADAGADDVRSLVLDIRGRLGEDKPAVVALTGVAKERPLIVIATNEAARKEGIKAGALVKTAATILGGGGGGKPDIAQGGGTDTTKIADALEAVRHAIATR
ncbi:Alanine--tRNA ligase [Dermatophilus congolensis]|uniref:Alanine--tRNA ligase n=1 Tax=Dermatophilus congolensis TaxID=1863 RepID=A0AA46GZX8_9MICO|nr:alanine--tRNA ligase [Dermatophilus congolensis]STD06425.1 Alanine--tRNA ligase [Dermatophilus congolensis]